MSTRRTHSRGRFVILPLEHPKSDSRHTLANTPSYKNAASASGCAARETACWEERGRFRPAGSVRAQSGTILVGPAARRHMTKPCSLPLQLLARFVFYPGAAAIPRFLPRLRRHPCTALSRRAAFLPEKRTCLPQRDDIIRGRPCLVKSMLLSVKQLFLLMVIKTSRGSSGATSCAWNTNTRIWLRLIVDSSARSLSPLSGEPIFP